MIQIGDIVRVVLSSHPMSTRKRHLINETGVVTEQEGITYYVVHFFKTGEKAVFSTAHLTKEEDWINKQKRSV